MSIPTIQLSPHQAIELADSTSFEVLGPSSSLEDFSDYSADEKDDNILQVPQGAVEIVESEDLLDSSLTLASPAPIGHRKRASFLSATVVRDSPEEKLGLTLAITSRGGGKLIISSIAKEGLLSKSPFKVGDRLVSINNMSCEKLRKSEATSIIRHAIGTLTVVVQNESGDSQLVESMVWKPQPNTRTGLAVFSNGYGKARVSNIRPNGLFESSLLSRRDLILSVNNVPCDFLNAKEVADIVMRAEDAVTVVAERKFENAVVVAMEQ